MPTTFGVIGPGKVGQALARRWREAGYTLLGFCGGKEEARAEAVRFAGGAVLGELAALSRASVVLVSVPDAAIAPVVRTAVDARAVRPCALWLHASGATGLAAMQPLVDAGARIGSLHPLCPLPSAAVGYRVLQDRVAVIDGPAPSRRLLCVLARAAGMRPIALAVQDRVLYHAACALAANGAMVLRALATNWVAAATGASAKSLDCEAIVASLLSGAQAAGDELGPARALTGPAARGDADTLRRHLAAIDAQHLAGRDVFLALMGEASAIAHARGDLSAQDVARVTAALHGVRRG